MIHERNAYAFCREDLSLIENYDKAIADKTQTWCCHHRDEVRVLPSGMTVCRSADELKENGRYYNCPANELIFLTRNEHQKLHSSHQKKIYGRKASAETKAKMSKAHKGKKFKEGFGKKVSEGRLKRTYSDFHSKFKEHYNCPCTTGIYYNDYQRELRFYNKFGHCSWEVENGRD